MNILTLVVEKAGNTGITPTQIYDQMNVGVLYGRIAKTIAVLLKDGFLSRLLSLAVDARVYNYRATKRGQEIYLNHSFDMALIQEMTKILKFHISPDVGMPDCICSLCRKVISEDEVPIRLFGLKWELRFHYECYIEFNLIKSTGSVGIVWGDEE